MRTLFGEVGRLYDPDEAPLSQIIGVINERYGLNLGDADRLLPEQFKSEMVADDELGARARANTLENSKLVFEKRF